MMRLALPILLLVLLPSGPTVSADRAEHVAARSTDRFDEEALASILGGAVSTYRFNGVEGGKYRRQIRLVVEDGEELLLVEEHGITRVGWLGGALSTRETLRAWFSLEKPGPLVRGEKESTLTGRASLRRTPEGLELTRGPAAGAEAEAEAEATEPTASREIVADAGWSILRILEEERWVRSGPEAGETFTMDSTDWSQPEFPAERSYTSLGRGPSSQEDAPAEVQLLRVIDKGRPFEFELEIGGGRSWGSFNEGMVEFSTVPAETTEDVEAPFPGFEPGDPIDLDDYGSMFETMLDSLFDGGRIDTDIPLGQEERLDELVLRADGVPADVFLEGPGQSVEVLGTHSVRLHVRAGDRVREPAPLTEEQKSLYTAATDRYRLADPELQETARSIVFGVREPLAIGTLLSDWVYTILDYDLDSDCERSDLILENEIGDCTEHTILFVALARARGVPARPVTGLVWTEDEDTGSGFYRHAWAEFHDGLRWISVDPTWGQVGVDAGHIRLNEPFDDIAGEEMHEEWFRFELEMLRRSPTIP
jgi:hypothetical protein